jgi:TM2 domain-containing membrane protein YozV
MYCSKCGTQVQESAKFCSSCGQETNVRPEVRNQVPVLGHEKANIGAQYPDKSKWLAVSLALVLGSFGAHKFYLGKNGLGILYLVFFWSGIPLLLGIFEAILLAFMPREQFRQVSASSSSFSSPGYVRLDGKLPANTSLWKNKAFVASVSLFCLFVGIIIFAPASNNEEIADSGEVGTSQVRPLGSTTAPQSQNSPTTLSSAECSSINSAISSVQRMFDRGTASPRAAANTLTSAAAVWSGIAATKTGSDASWLDKMSELSLDLKGYISNGSPSNGEQLFDQLYSNFGLSQQFCG